MPHRRTFWAVMCILWVGTAVSAGQEGAVAFHKLTMKAVPGLSTGEYQSVSGHFRFSVTSPDDALNPRVWESGVKITDLQRGTSCSTEATLISEVYASTIASLAIVRSYSGSAGYLNIYDIRTCRATSPEIRGFVDRFEIRGDRISVLPDCDEENIDGLYRCAAGQVFKSTLSGQLVLLEKESAQLTQERLGVPFVGQKKLKNPRIVMDRK